MLRQLVLDSISHHPPQTLSMMCRILHIYDLPALQKTCNQLCVDGLTFTKPDESNTDRYYLSQQGRSLIVETPEHYVRIPKFYRLLETKHTSQCHTIQQIRDILADVSSVTSIYLHTRLSKPIHAIQSALFHLLHEQYIVQCGPLFVCVDPPTPSSGGRGRACKKGID